MCASFVAEAAVVASVVGLGEGGRLSIVPDSSCGQDRPVHVVDTTFPMVVVSIFGVRSD